jgi:DNA-binding CsgD family transcriptional regulator
MKGGTIRGNINNVQNPVPCGGGVFIAGFGIFTMEGGVIMNNNAYLTGGGFHTGGRGSFKKTGGIIYGQDAQEGYRNTAIDGSNGTNGHALCTAFTTKYHTRFGFRDDTVGENDNLTFTGHPRQGILEDLFGMGENWNITAETEETEEANKAVRNYRIISLLSAMAICGFVIIFIIIKRKKNIKSQSGLHETPLNIDEFNLSAREKETFWLLLTEMPLKQIANKLNITYSGLTFHTKKIYRKLGIQSRTELLVKFKN